MRAETKIRCSCVPEKRLCALLAARLRIRNGTTEGPEVDLGKHLPHSLGSSNFKDILKVDLQEASGAPTGAAEYCDLCAPMRSMTVMQDPA